MEGEQSRSNNFHFLDINLIKRFINIKGIKEEYKNIIMRSDNPNKKSSPRFDKRRHSDKSKKVVIPSIFKNMRDDNKLANREKISKKIEPTVVFPMRLNKYVAHCGICARRKAAELVKEGQIWINGVQEFNPSYFVVEKDEVTYKNKVLKPEEKFVYILMNKPKGVITTSQDEKDRKTVLDIIGQTSARIFPVGRLDRDTTGLLLLTNDGDLTKKLSHPSYKVKKVYDVKLNETVSKDDLAKIAAGIILDDGKAEVDGVSYIDGENRNQVQITLHIGKNRVIRRIFESLGYDVIKLDRVYYAGLTKKDLPRGKYRFLNEREVIMLKHFT